MRSQALSVNIFCSTVPWGCASKEMCACGFRLANGGVDTRSLQAFLAGRPSADERPPLPKALDAVRLQGKEKRVKPTAWQTTNGS